MIFLIKLLLLLTVLLTPLMGVTKNLGYEQAKVLFFIVLTSLSGFIWLLTKPKFKWSAISKLSGLFILVLFVTSVTGFNPTASFLGIPPYFQGVILYAYLFLFFLLVSASKIKLEHWAYVLVGSAALVSLLAIKQWVILNILGMTIPSYAGRAVSTFGQPNFYAGFILLVMPFFYLLLTQKRAAWQHWLVTAGFLMSLVALILSQSRTAYLLLAVLMVIWLVYELKKWRGVILAAAAVILLTALFSSVYFSSGFLEDEFSKIHTTLNPDLTTIGVEKRYYFWPVLWRLILQRPLQGYGLENIAYLFSQYFTANYHTLFEANSHIQQFMFGLKDLNLDRSHNYILDLLMFSGILGLLSWLFLIVMILRKLIFSKISSETTTILLGFSLYLIWVQFQNQSIVHLLYFWLLAGMIDSVRIFDKGE